jgi:hypothetical protein
MGHVDGLAVPKDRRLGTSRYLHGQSVMEGTRPQGSSSAAPPRASLHRRFPNHVATIELLIKDYERFREFCDDYLECGKVLRRLNEVGDTTQLRIGEYEDSQTGLEQQLLECIEERTTCPHRRRSHSKEVMER